MREIRRHLIFFLLAALLATILIYGVSIALHHFGMANDANYFLCIRIIQLIAFNLNLVIIVIEAVSLTFDKTASKNTLIFSIFLFLYMMTNCDTAIIIDKISTLDIYSRYNFFIAFKVINSVFLSISLSYLIFFFVHDYHIKFSKKEGLYTLSFILIALIYQAVLLAVGREEEASYYIIILAIFEFYWLVRILIALAGTKQLNITSVSCLFLFLFINISSLFNSSYKYEDLILMSFGICSLLYLVSCFLFIFIYLHFVYMRTIDSYKNAEYLKQAKDFKTKMLLNQVSPHYIFNSLNTIKNCYSVSKEKGDKSINLLANNLRNVIEISKNNIVSLEDELNLVMNYVDFENFKLDKPFEIIFDIEVSSFMVPSFSIQTLVENAIKYSKLNELGKECQVYIHSFEDDDSFFVEVIDEGVGFVFNNVDKHSTGLMNTKNRIELIFNGSLSVESNVNIGTKITIKIPKKAGGGLKYEMFSG
ncbi:MAG: histidine kinase [Candidatus Onthovivens sp.]|nr:histidine kinase [Candidatus Onthovivens sp.]